MSLAKSGENHPMFGKQHSKNARENMSKSKRGENNPFFGKIHSEETKQRMSKIKIGKKRKNSSSKYFNVSKINKRKNIRWRVMICERGKIISVGCFETELEAARAYDAYVIEHNLNRPLNFPEEYNI